MENKLSLLDPSLDKQLKGHRGIITSLFYSPNELQIASGSLDNSVLLWDLGGTMRSYRFRGHEEAVMDVSFSPSGKYMASASRDKTVRLWIPTVTGSTGVFKAHSQTVRSVQFSPDGSKIVTASDDKIVKLWSSEKYKFIASFVGHTNWVRCARMSGDGSIIASCSDDKSTRLWNPDSGELIHTYKDQKGHPMHVAWHPSGCYVAVATSQGNIKLYDIRTHNLVQYYSIHNDAATQIAFHPSGSYVLTASKDGKMKILDLLEGHPIFTLSGHTGPVNTVGFSPSGETFASAGEDKLVNIWKTNFTELANEMKENIEQNPTVHKTMSQTSKLTSASRGGRNQGPRTWYLCYHTVKYPATAFVHLDDQGRDSEPYTSNEPTQFPSIQEHSDTTSTLTKLNRHVENVFSNKTIVARQDSIFSPFRKNSKTSTPRNSSAKSCNCPSDMRSCDCLSNSVGHMSHIPRTPPSPGTYTIPSFMPTNDKSIETATCCQFEEDLFGMIKLKENDVCYTSGTIEWVGRKRTYPINSGFKVLNDSQPGNEPFRKMKKFEKSCEHDKTKDCDCPDVLPTVNAIVDHLNALHEAVDLVDLRLNTLEGTYKKNH